YIGNRLIDLSYAAAQQIGIVDTGGGEVDIAVVRLGKGEREPPAPYNVAVVGPTTAAETPKVEVVPAPPPVTVENVQVVETRRQVSPSGKTVETVPVPSPPAPVPVPAPRPVVVTPPPAPTPAPARTGHYAVQVGAFSVEAN